jgi:curved DNA-binding protein
MSAREALSLLGLTEHSDSRQLRGAYLAAVKAAHPDKPGGDAERLRRVIEAHDVLRAQSAPEPPPPRAPARRGPARPAARRLEITPFEAAVGGLKSVPLEGHGEIVVRLPAGLRVGDLVAVGDGAMTVAIPSTDGAAVIGDHLCLTVRVERMTLSSGGEVRLTTPRGPIALRITPQDGARGMTRVAGAGLPARGTHGQGDLIIKLEPEADAGFETRTRVLLRRFVANWAA